MVGGKGMREKGEREKGYESRFENLSGYSQIAI
jgi:hypothetical protein